MSYSSSLVSPAELVTLRGEVTVLDVRWALGRSDGFEQYLAGHVPGARYVDLETDLADPATGDGRGRHPLPDPERFAERMRALGVSRQRPVVVYDDVFGTSAARAWWLLRYHGHPDVRLLDGGWTWYVRDGGPVETGEPDMHGAEPWGEGFVADPGHLPVLDADGAARVAAEGVLIDARAPERYRGEAEPVDPVAGHVPGAVNVPTAANLVPAQAERHGHFRPADDLVAAYEKALGAAYDRGGDAEVGVYCGSGVTAAHDVFALHLLGLEAALFAPSWSGWVADPQRPVETGG